MRTFADRIKHLRFLSGLNSKDFAHKIGIGSGTLSSYENGTTIPSGVRLLKISEGTGKSAEWLLHGVETSDSENSEATNLSAEQPLTPMDETLAALKLEVAQTKIKALEAELRAAKAELEAATAKWELERNGLKMDIARLEMEKAKLEAKKAAPIKNNA